MEENKILRTKMKDSETKRITQYWLFFKANILEVQEIREKFQNKILDQEEFRKIVRELRNPSSYGPNHCRGSSESAKRNCRELLSVIYIYYLKLLHPSSKVYVADSKMEGTGLGIFLREPVRVPIVGFLLPYDLFGVVNEVDPKLKEELDKKNYPSLYKNQTKQGILVGPISLLNHSCGANLTFASSNVTLEEEFKSLATIGVRAYFGAFVGGKDEEVYIRYAPEDRFFIGTECKCLQCTENAQKKV